MSKDRKTEGKTEMTVGWDGEMNVTDRDRTQAGRGVESTDGPWIGQPCDLVELDPETPTVAAPGSMEKVMMLQARYAAGVPLWDERDSYDHSKAPSTQAMLTAASTLSKSAAGVGGDVVEEQGEPLAI
ncbi:MAG TPA: hypothetical protein DCE43_00715 [Planctomycetaceae bacterium]|nr:hypothetical protein [Planctomycetaceae bacterium]